MRQPIKTICSLMAFAIIASSAPSRAQEGEHVDKTERSDQGVLVVRHDQPAVDGDGQDVSSAIPKPEPRQEDEPGTPAADVEKISVVRHDAADAAPTEVAPQPGTEAQSHDSIGQAIQRLRVSSGALFTYDRVVMNRTYLDWSIHGNQSWTFRRLDMTYHPPRYASHKTRTDWTYRPTRAPKHTRNRDWTYRRR